MAGAYVMGNYSYKVDRREKEIIFNRILGVKDEGSSSHSSMHIRQSRPSHDKPRIVLVCLCSLPCSHSSSPPSCMLSNTCWILVGFCTCCRLFTKPLVKTTLRERERVVPSIIDETLKYVVAQYNSSQSITQRELPTSTWDCMMFQLPPLTFGKEFIVVVEATQGEAKSAQLIGYVISNNSACITLARIEASKEIAHILAASTNTVYLNSDELLSIFEI
ncbi:hypothetical protein ACS0TY_016539 [Phlomoides rotata]